MKKYKIAVYAICKNEEKFVDRWYESVKEADSIFVLDTGSTDNTVKKLKKHKINVKAETIEPWRFDVARNKSLDMVPDDYDICVCLDLDEVIKKGWRMELEKNWANCDRLAYKYNWSHDENNNPNVSFLIEKIHSRKNYIWKYPVHEVLEFQNENERIKTCMDIEVDHYPDINKSRSSYLHLLELSVSENPEDDRNMHYLGREYMYYHEWDKAITTLEKHLNLKSAIWKEERCASMRFIGRCYANQNRIDEATMWYKKAIEECSHIREGYVELAIHYFRQNNFLEVINNCIKALTIKENKLIYINEPFCWDSTIDDLLSISYYNLGLKDLAIFHVNKALEYDNKNSRLLANREIFMK